MNIHKVCHRRLVETVGKSFRRYEYTYTYSTSKKLYNAEIRKKRNALFDEEKKRQFSLITRITKIGVNYKGVPEECLLVMNEGLSTPYNCAMHIGEMLTESSVLAEVDGEVWDMHRPLENECELRFLHFKDEQPMRCNNAFWRTCSFLLGHVLETAFKDDYHVKLYRFPKPEIHYGSFVHDVDLSCLPNWMPDERELRCLSRIVSKLIAQKLPFERLQVHKDLASHMFVDNKYKMAAIKNIAENSKTGEHLTLYRVGEHIDITGGPCIANTHQISLFNITAVHDIEDKETGLKLKRVQGVALPRQLKLNYWTYEQLVKRSKKLNTSYEDSLAKYKAKQQMLEEQTDEELDNSQRTRQQL